MKYFSQKSQRKGIKKGKQIKVHALLLNFKYFGGQDFKQETFCTVLRKMLKQSTIHLVKFRTIVK